MELTTVLPYNPMQGTGHFTQLLWNATTNIGMGHAIGSDGTVYIAARYTPPGNDAREGSEIDINPFNR